MYGFHITNVVKSLMIINVVFFILQGLYIPIIGYNVQEYFTLYDLRLDYFKPHQFLTHLFIHNDLSHLFFNMFSLFIFGPIVETFIGERKFFILYFVTGLGAAFIKMLSFYISPESSSILMSMIGASGATSGVMLACASLFPNREIQLMFIPIPIKMKHLAIGYIFLDVYPLLIRLETNVAHYAHLGGMLFALILLKIWKYDRQNFY